MLGIPYHFRDLEAFELCERRWTIGSPHGYNLGINGDRVEPKRVVAAAIRLMLGANYGPNSLKRAQSFLISILGDYRFNTPADHAKAEAIGLGVLEHFYATRPAQCGAPHMALTSVEGVWADIQQSVGQHNPTYRATYDTVYNGSSEERWLVRVIVSERHAEDWRSTYLARGNTPEANLAMHAVETAYKYRPAGTLYLYLRYKAPVKPERLTTGKFSVRKDMDTTAQVYGDTLRAAGVDPMSGIYQPFMEQLELKGNTFQDVFMVPYAEHAVRSSVRWLWQSIQAMNLGVLSWISQARLNNVHNCASCPFIQACADYENGGDWQETLNIKTVEQSLATTPSLKTLIKR